jgi:hypothetical protein
LLESLVLQRLGVPRPGLARGLNGCSCVPAGAFRAAGG